MASAPGPLAGVRVLELASIGPGPFACMLLADLGADVIRVDRPGSERDVTDDPLLRWRHRVTADLKTPAGTSLVLDMAAKADVLVEGWRPGVAERLGVGPADCSARNPRLVYGRVTGWGQTGPLAATAGHDLNYIAVSGILHGMGRPETPPPPPLNLIGDFGGGAMLLVVGVLAALVHAHQTGKGQVVDAAMTDGAALLNTMIAGFAGAQQWKPDRGSNLLDGGAPFYDTYATVDGGYVSVGAIEPQFYAELVRLLDLSPDQWYPQDDREAWPGRKAELAAVIGRHTTAELDKIFDGSDACYAPVVPLSRAHEHPHNAARQTYIKIGSRWLPAPAPRFSATPVRPLDRSAWAQGAELPW